MDVKIIFRPFGPDFKKNHLAEPLDSVHIMCKLPGVTPEPLNSSVEVTQEMCADSYDQRPGETQKQPPENRQCGLVYPEIEKIQKGVSWRGEGGG